MVNNKILNYIKSDNNALGMTLNSFLELSLKKVLYTLFYVVGGLLALLFYKIIIFMILPKNNFIMIAENIIFYLLVGVVISYSFHFLNKINHFSKKSKLSFKPFIIGIAMGIPQSIFYFIFSKNINGFFIDMFNNAKNKTTSSSADIFYPLLKYFAIPSLINSLILLFLSFLLIHVSLEPKKYKSFKDYIINIYKSIKCVMSFHTTITNVICFNLLISLFGFIAVVFLSGILLNFMANKNIAGLIMISIFALSILIFFIIFIRNIISGLFKIYNKSQNKFYGTSKYFIEDVSYGTGTCQYIIPKEVIINP